MKVLIIGDLHGKTPQIKNKDFDCIILVGDISDDSEIRKYTKKWFSQLKNNKNKSIQNMEDLIIKEAGISGFNKMEERSIERGNKILKYIDSFGKPVFMVAGNWDQSYGETRIKNHEKNQYNRTKTFYDYYLGDSINQELIKGTKNIKNCMFKYHEFMDINFFGYGNSSAPENPNRKTIANKEDKQLNKLEIKKLKKAYNKIITKLNNRYDARKNKKLPTFFISHNIPENTKLDLIKDKKSYAYGKHFGSTIARKFCVKHKPMICVGGHIHEGKGKDKIGKTVVINPGMDNVVINIEQKKAKIKSIKFIK